MKALLAVLAALGAAQAAHAGIPVVGGPVDLAAQVQWAMASPEFAPLHAELAEAARRREADTYNRKKAEDLKRAQEVTQRTEARPVRAGPAAPAPLSPPAQADTRLRPVAVPGLTTTNQPKGE